MMSYESILMSDNYRNLNIKFTFILGEIDEMSEEINAFFLTSDQHMLRIKIKNVGSIISGLIPELKLAINYVDLIAKDIDKININESLSIKQKTNQIYNKIAEGNNLVNSYTRKLRDLSWPLDVPIPKEDFKLVFVHIGTINSNTRNWTVDTLDAIEAVASLPQRKIISRLFSFIKNGKPILEKVLSAITSIAPIIAAVV